MPSQAPVSTYRLQLTGDFGFDAAAGLAGYLEALGVTHAYLSPILQAVPGSRHGYDVVDHSLVSADLGGEDAFRAMSRRLREHGIGVIVDIVPNHMAVPAPESLNRQLWSVLREGAGSPFAGWFDVAWSEQDGRLLLPVLAAPVADCLADMAVGEGDDGEPVLRYLGHVLPLRPGTDGLPLPELLGAQHYRLAWWRDATRGLNWRRFFDVTSLIAIRAEDPAVFAATHEVPLRLMAEGLIDGLRVDHPDGLADPRAYFRRLREAAGGAWTVAEKILADGEDLPADWECAGTTGYDALAMTGGVFTDTGGEEPVTEEFTRFTGPRPGFAEAARRGRRQAASIVFTPEVSRLARLLAEGGLDAGPDDLRAVLTEILAAFPVYRAYVVPGEPPPVRSVTLVREAAAAARDRLPAGLHGLADAVADAALGGGTAEFAVRFQQATGAVVAKGVEDTAFYRWSRLTALNEVGGDPGRFGVRPAQFHAFAARLAADWPVTMTTLSTHDTKRQEDVRARLAVLAERTGEWARLVDGWHAAALRLIPDGAPPPEPDTEYLMWQTILGAWPVSPGRLREYLRKAMREAKTRTSWADRDPAYEESVLGLAGAVLADGELIGSVTAFAEAIAPDARVNSLGAKLVQLTMPGVPDVYQGCELAGLSLVDPDNRRDVDFGLRRKLLALLDSGEAAPGANTPGTETAGQGLDAEKLLVTSRALRLRRRHPGWFSGGYAPVEADGPAAGHALAFARGGKAVTVATRLPAGLRRRGGWTDTVLALPAEGGWLDVLTGARHGGSRPQLSELTARLPVALLVPASEAVR